VVTFTLRPLYPQGKSPSTHWIGGCVDPRAVLDAVVKRKIPSSRRESNPITPIVQPVAQPIPTELSRLFFQTYHRLKKSKPVISDKIIPATYIIMPEAARSSETLVSYIIIQRHNPEDHDLNLHRREYLKCQQIFPAN
jgi:hypothetical protein